MIDYTHILKDTGLVAADAAGQVDSSDVIVNLGEGLVEGHLIIDVTAIEIAIPYLSMFDSVRAPLLIGLSLVKFVTVVGVFMHLRWDLRSYRLYFLFGLIGALAVFMVVLAVFRAF